jgi:hypothetical protein
VTNFATKTYPKKHCLGPQNGPESSGPGKTAKNSKLSKLPEICFEPVGKGGWPPISTWINLVHTTYQTTSLLRKYLNELNFNIFTCFGLTYTLSFFKLLFY